MRTVFTGLMLALNALASGCAMIEGIANTNQSRPLPPSGTYTIANVGAEPSVARKIERMIAYRIEAAGYTPAREGARGDIRVTFAFDVVPEGATSDAYTILNPGRTTTTFVGDTAYSRTTPATAVRIGGTRIFKKTIAVRIDSAETGQPYWDGTVSETGWCDQIFVTAPQILGLMFNRFPNEVTNSRVVLDANDPRAQPFRKLFPPDTDWGCGRPR